jgi:hypothetical protein
MASDSANGASGPYLSVEAILAAADTQTDEVDVPEWGGKVKVIGLTKRQQVDIRREALVAGEIDPELVQQYIWREGVIEPRFPTEQLGALFEKNAGIVDRVLAVVLRLSGMEEGSVKEKEKTFRP